VIISLIKQSLNSFQQLAEPSDERMTAEQLRELGEALSILSAKSSVLKERDELRTLMEENMHSEEVGLLRLV
jgi:LETM1 and EF-hand domain-containing protein 1, mitochondrial